MKSPVGEIVFMLRKATWQVFWAAAHGRYQFVKSVFAEYVRSIRSIIASRARDTSVRPVPSTRAKTLGVPLPVSPVICAAAQELPTPEV
jgi:hypothetical protein